MSNIEDYEKLGPLPDKWESVALKDVVSKLVDGSHNPPRKTDSGLPMLSARNIENNQIVFDKFRFISEDDFEKEHARTRIEPGDVLLTIVGTIGRVAVVPATLKVFTLQRSVAVLTPNEILPKYLMYQLQAPFIQRHFIKNARGTAQKGVYLKTLGQTPIRVAPLEQQKRIVAEIEKQFSRLDEAVANLKRVKANLKRYKAAVLKAAVEGKLTEKWRKEQAAKLAAQGSANAAGDTTSGAALETAEELLKRILAERRQKWEEAELAKMKAKGKNPKDEKWKKKYKEPTLPDKNVLPDIPEGWVWLTPELLKDDSDNAICAGPFGTIFKAKDFRSEGVPIIFLRHVAPGKYLTHKPGFMDVKKWEELFKPYSVYGGELLITKLGEPPGVCAIYPEDIGPAMVTPDVMKMSVNKEYAVANFLMHFFNSQYSRDFAASLAFGTTRLRLTLPIFRALPVPVPSLAEQKTIVEEVDQKISTIEALDELTEKHLLRVDRLKQSILSKAFSGQLVQADPGDEPASVLLGRIRKVMLLKPKPKRTKKTLSAKKGKKMKSTDKRMLLEVLREHPDGITPESLLLAANYTFDEVDLFYAELVKIIDNISEEKPSGDDALAWPLENKVILCLRSGNNK